MVYKTVSCKEIIGRLLRRTRTTDSSYMDDLLEWIPEAMDKLKTRQQYFTCYKTLHIKNYSAKLPCGLVWLEAVSYNGFRLREGSSIVHPASIPSLEVGLTNATATTIFVPDTEVAIENHLDVRISGTDLIALDTSSNGQYYKIQLDYIQTSFEEGDIVIYYLKRPVDIEGYVLVPDNEDYKEAIFWYLKMMMIEAGYEDPIHQWKDCYELFYNVHGPRAITDISYPSVDTIESLKQSTSKLIPPQHYYDDFFINAEQYNGVNK